MLYIDDVMDHHCMAAEFEGTGKIEKSRFCHCLWQKHNIALGETVYGAESLLLPPAIYIFLSSLEKLLKRCLILKQGYGTEKNNASD